uniref:Uncharacterized protein n=1 Tax=Anopheles funestus TaxID=62324 RepID=A0A182S2H8_ANOFN
MHSFSWTSKNKMLQNNPPRTMNRMLLFLYGFFETDAFVCLCG